MFTKPSNPTFRYNDSKDELVNKVHFEANANFGNRCKQIQITNIKHFRLTPHNVQHGDILKVHQNSFYFMYSNTIYILNNTIIECFDIVFNKKKKNPFKKSFVCYSRLEKGDIMVFCMGELIL